MSGGAFNYINMADFIDVIKYEVTNNVEKELYDYSYDTSYSPEIINILIDTIKELEIMDKKLHAIDYLLEGDYSEESFLKEWKEIK